MLGFSAAGRGDFVMTGADFLELGSVVLSEGSELVFMDKEIAVNRMGYDLAGLDGVAYRGFGHTKVFGKLPDAQPIF